MLFDEPVGHLLQIAGKGTKLADMLLGTLFGDGHQVKIGPHINAGRVGINLFQYVFASFGFALGAGRVFLCYTSLNAEALFFFIL